MIKKDKLLILPLVIIGVNLLLFFGVTGLILFSYNYPYLANGFLLLQMLLYCNIPALLSGVYMTIYIIIRKWLRKWLKIIITIIATTLILLTLSFSLKHIILMPLVSPFGSQTTDIKNYLKVDSDVEDSLSDIFPKSIPESAENIQYFYRYRDIIEEDYDIYLKVTLSKTEFESEKERISQQFPNAEVVKIENGVVEYRVNFEDNGSYYYEFISFFEKDLTVIYVISYSLEGRDLISTPYFEEIQNNSK